MTKFKENVSKPMYKVGDTVRITKNLHGHGFKKGVIVKIKRDCGRNYLASKAGACWYVTADEIEKVCLDKQE